MNLNNTGWGVVDMSLIHRCHAAWCYKSFRELFRMLQTPQSSSVNLCLVGVRHRAWKMLGTPEVPCFACCFLPWVHISLIPVTREKVPFTFKEY